MKAIQKLFGVIIIFVLLNCEKRADFEPKYKEISGIWKLESAELNGAEFVNSDLINYDLIQIPYKKIKQKYRDNQSIYSGLFFMNDSTKNLDLSLKKFHGYKIKPNNYIEFMYHNPDFGPIRVKDDLINKIFVSIWSYKIDGNQLRLSRNKIMTDSLGGLKLVYRKAN